MTRALVACESMSGDARAIAHAIADDLSASVPADVVAAAGTPDEISAEVDPLVVGGPNHGFGMPRPTPRKSAVEQYGAAVPDVFRGLHQ